MIANSIITFIVEFINRFIDFHDFACGMIFLFAVSSFIYFYILNKNMNSAIISLTKNVEDLTGSTDEKMVVLNELINTKEQNKTIKTLWKKYYDTLLKYGAEGASIEISSFFNKATLVDIPTKRKIAEIIPGLLIATGILGTFTGLVIGLNSINVSDASAIQSSMIPLLQGLKIGFLTSVLGIGSSLTWNLMDRIFLHRIVKSVNEFQVAFDQTFPAESLGGYLIEMIKLQSAQTAAVEQMSSNISGDQSKPAAPVMEEQVFSKFSNAISSAISKNMEPLVSSISQLNSNISNIENSIRDSSGGSSASAGGYTQSNAAGEGASSVLDSGDVHEQLGGILEGIKESVSNQKETGKYVSEINDSIKEVMEGIQKSLEQAVSSSMSQLNQGFINSVGEIMDKIQGGIKDALGDELSKMTQQINGTVESIQSTVEKTSNEFDQLKQSMKNVDNKLGDKILYPSKTKRSDGEFY